MLLLRRFYTQKFLHTDALHKDAFARINQGTQALLHTEPFTQRNLCTEQFLHKETFTQESFDIENLSTQTAQRSYTPKLLHAETLPRAAFTEAFPHRSLYAQKSLCTAVFTQTLLHTYAFTQNNFTHRSLCTQHAFPHSQLLQGEALLPLLDHLPFVFPLSSILWIL